MRIGLQGRPADESRRAQANAAADCGIVVGAVAMVVCFLLVASYAVVALAMVSFSFVLLLSSLTLLFALHFVVVVLLMLSYCRCGCCCCREYAPSTATTTATTRAPVAPRPAGQGGSSLLSFPPLPNPEERGWRRTAAELLHSVVCSCCSMGRYPQP